MVLLTLGAVTHYHPAAVGPRVSSRGRRQDQLTELVTLPDAGGGNQKHETFTFTSTYSATESLHLPPAPQA